jgi:hypothetical protein
MATAFLLLPPVEGLCNYLPCSSLTCSNSSYVMTHNNALSYFKRHFFIASTRVDQFLFLSRHSLSEVFLTRGKAFIILMCFRTKHEAYKYKLFEETKRGEVFSWTANQLNILLMYENWMNHSGHKHNSKGKLTELE